MGFSRSLTTWILCILSTAVYCQSIVINEIQASNSQFTDQDGDTPDWLEVRNLSTTDINLKDWSLSDDKEDLTKWLFTDFSLTANEHLLVWASGKNKQEIGYAQSIITEGDEFKYLIPNSALSSDWNSLAYDDSSWDTGVSGFGYGDNDDNTQIPDGTRSIFIRKKFTIDDISSIVELIMHIDFDDGYVAYINGKEVSRENISGQFPAYDQFADDYLEALLINGQKPLTISIDDFTDIIEEGENVLAIQVHNFNTSSSDMTMIPFLSSISTTDILDDPIPILEVNDLELHTNFKISSSSETIYLSDPTGLLIDSMSVNNLPANISIGLNPINDIVYFETPTPGTLNSGTELIGIVNDQINFSELGGITNPLELSLTGISPPHIIRYALDGAVPDESSPIYTAPITINQNTVVRARIFRQNYLPSPTQTETYFINIDHNLPIISLVTDTENLFNEETGIYSYGDNFEFGYPYFGANFWQDWERPIHFSILETDGIHFSFDGGIKIFGGWSRANDQRSFSLFARSKYGPKQIDYPLFSDNSYDTYQAFILRNSGNDWQSTMMRDGTLTGLMRSSILETQAYKPTVAYINGEFWGLYNMREKVNEHFLASRHNIDPDEIQIMELNSLPIHGSSEDYEDLIDFASNTNFVNDINYDMISDLVDIDNIIMYYLAQIYFNNTDWPGNNIKYWKETGGKWKWILFDTDFGFGRWNYFDFQNNTLQFALQANGPEWPNPPWSTLLFRRLNQNLSFRQKFINQFADEMNSRFLEDRVHTHIDSTRDLISSEISKQRQRWGESANDWSGNVKNMKDFASERSSFCRQHILDVYNLPDDHILQILNTQPANGYVQLNSLTIEESNWSGYYFENVPISVTAIPRPGYKFVEWQADISGTDPYQEINMITSMQIRPIWELDEDYQYGVVINEINYNSDSTNDTGDWIELYNSNDEAMNLSGWIFKDDENDHAFIISEGTVLDSDDYLIIAKDLDAFTSIYTDVQNVIGNFDFGLSSTADQVRIYDTDNLLQDSVAYLSIQPWPTTPNGQGFTLELISPTLDNTLPQNWKDINQSGSPGRINQEISSTIETAKKSNITITPNPTSDVFTLDLESVHGEAYTLEIIDTGGKIVKSLTKDLKNINNKNQITVKVSELPPGQYFVRITTNIGNSDITTFEKI